MRNRYSGTCYRCGSTVAPRGGHFECVRVDRLVELGMPYARMFRHDWLVQHADCAIRYRATDFSIWNDTSGESLELYELYPFVLDQPEPETIRIAAP